MKNLIFLAAASALLFSFSFCKNTPLPEGQTMVTPETSTEPAAPPAPLPPGKSDTLVGFRGCERAAWSPLDVYSDEFIYQHYTVKKRRIANNPGEIVTVLRDSGRTAFTVPMPPKGYFLGICRNKLFVDAGSGPDGRHLFVFDVDQMAQLYETPYCGEPQIIESSRLHFLRPVDESEVTKMPDCPDKEQWLKDGLRVGYGQRCIYNLEQRSLTRKSEWMCVPVQ